MSLQGLAGVRGCLPCVRRCLERFQISQAIQQWPVKTGGLLPWGFLYTTRKVLDFPGGSVHKNLSANARDTGSIPGLGRFHMLWSNWAHVPQWVSQHSGARELQLLKPMCLEPVPTVREVTAIRSLITGLDSSSLSPQLEKACIQQWRPA